MKDIDAAETAGASRDELHDMIINLRTDIAELKGWHTGDYLEGGLYMRDAILRMIDSRLDALFARTGT